MEEKEMRKIPEGWKRVRLGEMIIDIGDGGTPSRDNPENFGGDILWVVIDDIKPYITDTKEKLSLTGLKNSNAKLWPVGSIVVSTGATIGEVGIAKASLATKQGITGIILNRNKVYEIFFRYLLIFNKNLLIQYSQGTSFSEIRPPTLVKLRFFIPPFPEQRKIAEILETIDNAIEKTDRIIEKYKRIKQGLLKDLLTKGIRVSSEGERWRLRDESTDKFKDSPIGRIPEEWEVVRLGEVITYEQPTRYLVKSENYDKKSGVPVLTPGKSFILGYTEETEGIYRNVPAIIFDDFTTECKYINFPFKVKSSAVKILKLENEDNKLFYLFNLLQTLNYKPGSEHKRFWISEYSKIQIPIPPIFEQHRIAEILSQIDETIEKEQRYKGKLERIKQGLMEDLLTGKVRVNHLIEEGVENVPQT